MRTYTQYVDGAEVAIPWKALVMYKAIVDGPTLTIKDFQKHFGDGNENSIYSAAAACVIAGWLEREKRGVYELTRLGRTVWKPLLERVQE